MACLALLLAAALAGGCAATGPAENSMPWNTPQNWEGSPALPIFTE